MSVKWANFNEYIETDDYTKIGQVYEAMGQDSNFSKENIKLLQRFYKKVKNPKLILEIGVDNNRERTSTSTHTFLKMKSDETYYFGIDLENKSHLNDPSKRIYTIQNNSQNIEDILDTVRDISGLSEIDFLFIDGFHSIKMCRIEWEGYTPFLAKGGVVGIHDINHHWGPIWLIDEGINRKDWCIANYPCGYDNDYGISFAWRNGEIS